MDNYNRPLWHSPIGTYSPEALSPVALRSTPFFSGRSCRRIQEGLESLALIPEIHRPF
jgi:hypothetical protein